MAKAKTKAELKQHVENLESDYEDLWGKASRVEEELRRQIADLKNEDYKAKATAQEARIMVLETAMQSMALHIQILINQKGKANA